MSDADEHSARGGDGLQAPVTYSSQYGSVSTDDSPMVSEAEVSVVRPSATDQAQARSQRHTCTAVISTTESLNY